MTHAKKMFHANGEKMENIAASNRLYVYPEVLMWDGATIDNAHKIPLSTQPSHNCIYKNEKINQLIIKTTLY